jgi:molecular chaperone DnaJ
MTDALLGAQYEIDSLEGKLKIDIPAGLQSNQLLRVRGKGVPGGGGLFGGGRGDLIIRTTIVMPKKISKEEKRLVEKLKEEGL